jgi:hypothetical protein
VKGYKPKTETVCTTCYRVKEYNANPRARTAPAYWFAGALLHPVETILAYRASREGGVG